MKANADLGKDFIQKDNCNRENALDCNVCRHFRIKHKKTFTEKGEQSSRNFVGV